MLVQSHNYLWQTYQVIDGIFQNFLKTNRLFNGKIPLTNLHRLDNERKNWHNNHVKKFFKIET